MSFTNDRPIEVGIAASRNSSLQLGLHSTNAVTMLSYRRAAQA